MNSPFDSKWEIAGAFLCFVATAALIGEVAIGFELLADRWIVGVLAAGVGVWLGPKTWKKLRGLSIGPLTFRSD